MAKLGTRSKSAKTYSGGGVRGRDVEFPSASIDVSDAAQAKAIDKNAARLFEFSSRMEQDKLPERPSTSGGPATNFSMRRNLEKRETRDDLHFNPLGAHGTGTTFYNFPLPGSLPTLNNTPNSSPPTRTSPLPLADMPESMEGLSVNLKSPHMEIGVAIGSLTHQPTIWQPPVPLEPPTRNETPDSLDTYVDSESHMTAPSRRKTSKWKILGGLFGSGKKHHGGPQNFYQLQPEGAVVHSIRDAKEADYSTFEEAVGCSQQKPSQPRGRRRTYSHRKPEKEKPDIKRSQTAPLNFDFQGPSRGKTTLGTPAITLDVDPLNAHPGKKYIQGGRMLDVDIPSIQMERYSVMFGGVLQKPTGTASSLLARRQATLEKLKTVQETLVLREQELAGKSKQLRPRRASSPQPAKSPAFSLFPNTPSRLTVRDGSLSPNRRSPLQRSNTSPAALSPSRPNFPLGPGNETDAALMAPRPYVLIGPEPQDKTTNQRKHEPKSSKQTLGAAAKPQLSTNYWSLEESRLTLDSPSSDVDSEEEDIHDPAPFLIMKPELEEPAWKMVVPGHIPSSSVSGSTSFDSHHSTSTSASSISTTSIAPFTGANLKTVKIQAPPPNFRSRSAKTIAVTVPRRVDPEASVVSSISKTPAFSIPAWDPRPRPSTSSASPLPKPLDLKSATEQLEEEHEQRLKTAADVSIARQISVSRQQHQLLIPMKVSSNPNLKAKYNQTFPSPLNTINMDRVASPLSAVASATKVESPIDGNGRRPVVERKASLVAASGNPSTPMLVVVGSGEKEKMWGGKAVDSTLSAASGEIRAGLAVGNYGNIGLSPGEMQAYQYRKSARVVVERLSITSN